MIVPPESNYLVRIGDALSQLANVLLLGGQANESISGRAYRSGWVMTTALIDRLIWWEREHCRRSHEADVLRAHYWARRYPR